jgi:two-component system nitrate/nitrite response regulator NarL
MIRVLIVADVRFYRDGLAETIPRDGRLCVIGTAAGRDEALERAAALRPDIVLLDTATPGALALTREVAERMPATKVVAIALAETEHDVLEWAEAGVAGYVPRDASIADLVAAVEGTARGELRCSTRVAAGLLRRLGALALTAGSAPGGGRPVQLTPRERDIADLLEQGMSNKDIARRLGIGVATAKTHVHHILEKLQVHQRAQAAAWVRRRGPLEPRHP